MSATGAASRRNGARTLLARIGIARIAHQCQHHDLSVVLGRDERHRRSRHHVGDRRELLWSGLGRGYESCDHFRSGGQQQHAAEDAIDRLQAVLEARGHAEVAAASANRPEQIGLGSAVDAAQLAVGGHDLSGKHAVDRESMLAGQISNAAAQGDAANSNRTRIAESGRQSVSAHGARVRRGCKPGLRPGRAGHHVHVQGGHLSKVQHHTTVGRAMDRVATAPNRKVGAGIPHTSDGLPNVFIALRHDNDLWTTIDAAGKDNAHLVVAGIAGCNGAARQAGTKIADQSGRLSNVHGCNSLDLSHHQ